MENYFEKFRTFIAENPPDFGDGESVLTLLYEAYAESNRMDDGTIKEDFNELYRQMNGMELREMDIDSILANQSVLKLQQELEAYCRTNEEVDKQIEEYRQLQARASTRAAEIRRIVAELSKEEYDNVGPALSKFYDKLARFNANGEFKIVPEKEGISLVDEKGKNVVNILSNGQISVFMLAYFFAGINARNDREKMKVFFIDDLTACMDDVNMLGFMDLLKYQLSSKETVDQLFFITCDDRISKLLKYKLSGRGIELCELLEAVFV